MSPDNNHAFLRKRRSLWGGIRKKSRQKCRGNFAHNTRGFLSLCLFHYTFCGSAFRAIMSCPAGRKRWQQQPWRQQQQRQNSLRTIGAKNEHKEGGGMKTLFAWCHSQIDRTYCGNYTMHSLQEMYGGTRKH